MRYFIVEVFGFVDLPTDSIADHKHAVCVDTVCNLSSGEKITEDMLDEVVQLPHKSGHGQFYIELNQSLRKLKGDPIFSMLSVKLRDGESLADAFHAIENDSSEVYFKLCIHLIGNNTFVPTLGYSTLTVHHLYCYCEDCIPQIECSCRYCTSYFSSLLLLLFII